MTATRFTSSGGGSGGGYGGIYDVHASPYNAVGDGVANDAAAINAALVDARNLGGTVLLNATKTYLLGSTPLVCDSSSKAFRLTGLASGHGHIHAGDPVLLWTGGAGTGPVISCKSVHGFELDHLHIKYTNGAFDGVMIDVDGATLFADATNWHIHDVSTQGDAGSGLSYTTALAAIRCTKAIIGHIHNCHLTGGQSNVRLGNGYCVGVQVDGNCTFNNATDAHILISTGDAEAITIRDCIFEAGNNTTAIRGMMTDFGDPVQNQIYGMLIQGNWFGDASSETHWIKDLHPQGEGPIVVIANRFADVSATTGVHMSGDGVWTIIGNHFEGGILFKVVSPTGIGAGERPIVIGNYYSNVQTEFSNGTASLSPITIGNSGGSVLLKPYEGFGRGRIALRGPSVDTSYPLTPSDEHMVLAYQANQGWGQVADKSSLIDGKTPNPAAQRSLILQAPWSGTQGEVNVAVGSGPYGVIQAVGAASAAGCKLGFYGTATPATQAARVGQLTDSTGGTVTSTLAAGITDAVVKNAIASLAAKVNALETIIHNLGLSA